MSKINNLMRDISETYRRMMTRYPITTILIFITALITSVFIEQDSTLGKFMEETGILFVQLLCIETFFVESCWPEKKIHKLCGIGAAALIAAWLVAFSRSASPVLAEHTGHWIAAYCAVLITMGIYIVYKKSGIPFNTYCLRFVQEMSRVAIILAITALGILLVMAIFITLLLGEEHITLIFRVELFVMQILLGCGVLGALVSPDHEMTPFFIFIVKNLLMILLLAAFIIIYAYILKIIVTRIVPSNEIFRILAGLFIIGLPIWTMIGTFSEDNALVRIGVKLPYIFIPFLFLQGYSIRERIAAYGMTPNRYLCLALMVFEVIYICVYALRRRDTGIMLPVFAVMAVIALAVPGINMFSVSNRSQKAIFDRYIGADLSSLPTEDLSNLAGAYYYLTGNEDGRLMLAGVDDGKIEYIKASGKTGIGEYDKNLYVTIEFPISNADINGFDHLTMVSTFVNDPEKRPDVFDPKAINIYDIDENLILAADISAFLDELIITQKKNPTAMPEIPGVIDLSTDNRLLVSHCEVTMEPGEVLTWLYLDGILLTKNQ